MIYGKIWIYRRCKKRTVKDDNPIKGSKKYVDFWQRKHIQ